MIKDYPCFQYNSEKWRYICETREMGTHIGVDREGGYVLVGSLELSIPCKEFIHLTLRVYAETNSPNKARLIKAAIAVRQEDSNG